MPGGDRTGPSGAGPMTGRRMGYCAGFEVPGSVYPGAPWVIGGGYGFRGAPHGWHRGYRAFGWAGWMGYPGWQPTQDQTLEMLKAEAQSISAQLEGIQRRITEIEGKDE